MSENNIRNYSINELRLKQQNGESKTDWDKLDAMTEEEIERNANEDDLELGIDGWDWSNAQLVIPKKQTVNMRLDQDIVQYFRELGPGYQTRINAILKAYVAHQRKVKNPKQPA